jgi:hypothetical protein
MSKGLITSILDESEIERIKTLDKLQGEINRIFKGIYIPYHCY